MCSFHAILTSHAREAKAPVSRQTIKSLRPPSFGAVSVSMMGWPRFCRNKGFPDVHATSKNEFEVPKVAIPTVCLEPDPFSVSIYGDPNAQIHDLKTSIREFGILVALVVTPGSRPGTWEVISGHRRLACALSLGLLEVPCEVREIPAGNARRSAILEFNRHRRKTFTQMMREADALEELCIPKANLRRLANLSRNAKGHAISRTDRRNCDTRDGLAEGAVVFTELGRTDATIADYIQLGGKDRYRQARAVWELAQRGDCRAQSSVRELDAGIKTIHAAYKDLRRRSRFTVDFRPTPYDVWSFRRDRAFGIPHPGGTPPGIVAHTLHYFTRPDDLVVDPMAGGGTTIDVCHSMGRRCLAYDLHPSRRDIYAHDIRLGFPRETLSCNLIFCDPPYHTMLARDYSTDGVSGAPLTDWISFLHKLAVDAYSSLQPDGYFVLLLAAQTEKDIPPGFGYLDHVLLGYIAAVRAGFWPVRRISCPMDGAYLPQHVRRARTERRLLGQVRDLLVLRKGHGEELRPAEDPDLTPFAILHIGSEISDLTTNFRR
jgi:ParB family transcriptional regulator, chromosome partitioning protein